MTCYPKCEESHRQTFQYLQISLYNNCSLLSDKTKFMFILIFTVKQKENTNKSLTNNHNVLVLLSLHKILMGTCQL